MATHQVSSTGTQTTGHPGEERMTGGYKDQPDPALYQRSVRDSQKGPQATGHQGGVPPTSHSMPPTGLAQSVHWSVWQEPEASVV